MHSFDTLARTLVGSPRRKVSRHVKQPGAPMLPQILSVTCALLPLAVMTHAYLLTA